MEFQDYFPVWEKLTSVQQQQLKGSAISRTVKKGTVLHNGNLDCTGLLLIRHGQLRSYILSEEGREITLYRLFDRDICLFSASCMMRMSFGVGSKEWLSIPAGMTICKSTWSPAI